MRCLKLSVACSRATILAVTIVYSAAVQSVPIEPKVRPVGAAADEDTCNALKLDIKRTLIRNGMYGFDLNLVDKDSVRTRDRVVGTCDDRRRAIVYTPGRNRDSVMELGGGDQIRFAGAGPSFDCDDPEYSKVDKIELNHIYLQDGAAIRRCMEKNDAKRMRETVKAAEVSGTTVETTKFIDCNAPGYPGYQRTRVRVMSAKEGSVEKCASENPLGWKK